MSKQIDERIVQMTFENRAFEQGIQTSITSLKKLDSSLDGLREKGKDSFKISFDMTGLQMGLEKIEQKMTATGIIGKRILENLTDSAMNFANGGVGAIFRQIKEGGKTRAFNIENARFQLMGLLNNAAEVSAVMKNAEDSVLDTAYGMDQAAKAASMLAASGMSAGDKMYKSLLGIAGVSAQLNADYDSIANIFTTVAGNGRLMGMQLTQLSTKGMNAAASIAKYMDAVREEGADASAETQQAIDAIVKKFGTGESAIRSAVTEGMVSFEMFSDAMSYAFGAHAKDANKTFTGSLSNLKAALSRIGQKFYSPLINSGIDGQSQTSTLIDLFTTLKEKINAVNKQLDPFANLVTGSILKAASDLRDYVYALDIQPIINNFYKLVDIALKFGEAFKNVYNGIDQVLKPVGIALKEVWLSTGINVIDVIDKFADKLVELTSKFKITYDQHAAIEQFFKNFLMANKNIVLILGRVIKGLGGFVKGTGIFQKVFEKIGKGLNYVFSALSKFFEIVSKINVDKFGNVFAAIEAAFQPTLLASANAICNGLATVLSRLGIEGDNLIEKWTIVKEKLNGIFGEMGSVGFLDSFKNRFGKTVKESELVAETFEVGLDQLGSSAKKAEIKTLEFGKAVNEVSESSTNDLSFLQSKLVKNVTGIARVALEISSQVTKKVGTKVYNSILKNFLDEIKETYADSGVIGVVQYLGSKLYEVFHAMMSKLYEIIQSPEFKAVYEIFLSANFVKIMKNISKWGGLLGKNPLINMQAFAINGSKNKISNTQALSKSLIEFAGAVLILVGALKLLSTIPAENTIEPLIALGSLMSAMTLLTGILGGLGKNFENSKRTALLLLALSASLLMAASGLSKLASVSNDQDQIIQAMIAMGVTIATIGEVMYQLKKLTGSLDVKPGETLQTLGGILLIGMAVSSIGKSLAKLADNDPVAIAVAGVVLGGIVAAFVKISAMWTKVDLKPRQIITLATMMYILSGSFAILAASLLVISLIPIDQISSSLQLIAGLFVGIAGVAVIIGTLGEAMSKGAIAFAAFAVGVALLSVVIKKMSEMENLAAATTVMIGIGALMLAFGFTMSILDNVDLRYVDVKSVLAVTASLILVVIAVQSLAKTIHKVGFANMLGAIISMGVMLAAMVGLIWVLNKMQDTPAFVFENLEALAVGMAALSGGILAMAIACRLLTNVPWQSLAKAGVMLGAIVAVFAALTVLAAMSGDSGAIAVAANAVMTLGKAFLLVGAGITLAAFGISAFSLALMFAAATAIPTLYLGLQNLRIFFEGLCDIIIELAPKLRAALAQLIIIVFGAIIDAWPVLKEQTMQMILKFGELLDEYTPQIVEVFGNFLIHAIDALAAKIPEINQAIFRFLDAMFGSLRESMAQADTESLLKGMQALSLLAVLAIILAADIALAPAALLGIIALMPVVAGLSLLLGEMGAISKIPGFKWLASGAGDLMEIVATNIGRFVGGFVSGIGLGMSNSFPKICDNLSKGMENLEPFLEKAKLIDKDVVGGIFRLTFAMMSITAAEFINGIERILHAGNASIFQTFGEQLESFGDYFVKFYNTVKDINDLDKINKICDAIYVLAEAANAIPNSGGLLGFVMGDNDISDFGRMLQAFGTNFKIFVDGLNQDGFLDALASSDDIEKKFEVIKKIIEVMASAAKAIPNTGGILGEWAGNNDIDIFAGMLAEAAPNIMKFVKEVSDIKPNHVTAAQNAAKALAAVVEVASQVSGDRTIAAANGMFGFAIHENSGFDVFCKQLALFGPSIALFAACVNGINVDAVTGAANASKIMAETVATLNHPGNGYSLADKLTPSYFSDLSEMGRDMVKYGKYMAKFSKVVSGKIDPQAMKDSAHFAKAMVEVAAALQQIDEGRKFFRNDTNIKDFGEMLEDFGKSVKKFYKQVKKIPMEDLTSFVENMQVLTDLARASATEDLDFYNLAAGIVYFGQTVSEGFSSAFAVNTDQVTTVINSLNGLLSSMKAALVSGLADFTSYIQLKISEGLKPANYRIIAYNNVVKALAEGMTNTNAQMTIKSAARNIGNLVRVSLTNTSSGSTMSNIGKNIVRGMVSGMLSMMPLVTSASMRLGAATEKSISSYLGIHSPSKVFHKLGVYTMQGFVDGMSSMDSVVGNTAGKIGSSTFDAMKESIEMMGQAINSDMDTSPRITPILDLDQLRRDAGSIDDMFGGTTFKMASESSNLMQRYVEAKAADHAMMIDNAKVVDAIGALRQDVNSMGMQMNNLQVVMDSGALVGQIARPMDAALGSRMIRREREA